MQYVVGLAFVTKHKKYKEALDAAFKLCDVDEDGLLSRDETRSSLKSIIPHISDEQVVYSFSSFSFSWFYIWHFEFYLILTCSAVQIQKFIEKLDAKNTKVISRAEFIHFLESNPEYLLVFLISAPHFLPQSKNHIDGEFTLMNGRTSSSYQEFDRM